jgi:hypothetical protein
MAEPLDISDLELDYRRGLQIKYQLIHLLVTALSSAGYIAYVLSFSTLLDSIATFYRQVLNVPILFDAHVFPIVVLAVSVMIEAILEIPTGRVADTKGHHIAIRASFILLTIHAALYCGSAILLAGSHLTMGGALSALSMVLVSECFLALGTALQSGALNAWFVQSMTVAGFSGRLTVFMARRRLVTNLTWLIVGAIVLAERPNGLWIPFAMGVFCYILGGIFSLILVTRVDLRTPDETGSFLEAWREIVETPILRSVFIAHTLFWSLGLTIAFFWQETLDPYKKNLIDAPNGESRLAIALAIVWLFIMLGRLSASYVASILDRYIAKGAREMVYLIGQFMLAVPMMILPVLAGFCGPAGQIWAIIAIGVAFAISRCGQELAKPIAMAFVHEAIRNERNRATIESILEGFSGFGVTLVAGVEVIRACFPATAIPGINPLLFSLGILGLAVFLVACRTASKSWFARK